jgi:hypothetical protein
VDESLIGGRRRFMEVATTINLDPTRTSGIRGLGCHKYWLISAWSKSKSPYANFSNLTALGLEGLGFATWGAFMLVIIWGLHLVPM